MNIYIHGIYGCLTVDAYGIVKDYTPSIDGDDYNMIGRIDLVEYSEYWGLEVEDGMYIDILDIGSWDWGGNYSPAEDEYREELKAIVAGEVCNGTV